MNPLSLIYKHTAKPGKRLHHKEQGLVGHCPLCSALTLSAQMDLDIRLPVAIYVSSKIFVSLTLKEHIFSNPEVHLHV